MLHSVFNILSKAFRAQKVGEIANPNIFSSPVPVGPDDQTPMGTKHAFMTIKAPGTDFIIPGEMAQFIPVIQQIIDYHYASKNTQSENKSGAEYCSIGFVQGVTQNYKKRVGPIIPHLDMNVDTALEQGGDTISDRYVASDKLPTIFYDQDLGFKADKLQRHEDGWKHWHRKIARKLRRNPAIQRSFGENSIGHFNTTTGHATVSPAEPVLRTFLTVSFSTWPRDDFNNPALDRLVAAQRSSARGTALDSARTLDV